MSDIAKLNEVLQQTANLALATAINDEANVRILSFCHQSDNPAVLYFSTDRDNAKVEEFAQNPQVAFTTIPNNPGGMEHVRGKAVMQKSVHSLGDLKALFLAKMPQIQEAFDFMEQTLDVWEIHIKEAALILDYDKELHFKF